MSLGANFSSGYTNSLNDNTIQAAIPKLQSIAYSDPCCSSNPVKTPAARYPSMVLLSKSCPSPTPAQFALYPKVAVPSSVRTQAIGSGSLCPTAFNPISRFAHFQRYQVPVPCAPLTPLASMAGISKPTTLECNIYPNT